MEIPASLESNQPATPSMEAQSRPAWRFKDVNTDADEEACEIIMAIFSEGRPLLAQDVYAAIQPAETPSKTVLCPRALKMGITKVKRRSGWWWVPPGVKQPTLAATREDPWAEVPKKGA